MTAGTPILAARGVSVRLGDAGVVAEASLSLAGGELVALVGPNGAGKTTLLRALAGLVPHDGEVDVAGRPLAQLKPRERAKLIGYLPQGSTFHWPLKAREIVALGRHPHGDPFSRPSAADDAAVVRALAATDSAAFADRSVWSLSGGERARVALARVLATEAPLLLADEPTAALDPQHQLAVMDRLRLAARAGAAVLAVTHDLSLAARFADRVIVMHRGRIIADASPAVALSAERMAAVFEVAVVDVQVDGVSVPVPLRPL